MTVTIPVIDLSALSRDSGAIGNIGHQVARACHEVGFCYLAGHRIPRAVEREAFAAVRAFFALGAASKARLSIANSPHFRGYTPPGQEFTRGRRDRREQLDLGLDEPAEPVGPNDPPWRRLRGPNQWPDELPGLRPAITAWCEQMQSLALDVLRGLAVGLGQPADRFDPVMLPRGDPHLKVIRYPGDGSPTDSQGVGWHHDSGLLTFILQDEVGGLEIRTEAGVVAAIPKAGTYLMNVGEMLQRATSGFLRATEHRVASPQAGQERISLAYFPHPKFESVFEPVPLPPALAARVRGGENTDPADPVHRCFGDNYLKIRLRSHPDVAARFYRDVIAGD